LASTEPWFSSGAFLARGPDVVVLADLEPRHRDGGTSGESEGFLAVFFAKVPKLDAIGDTPLCLSE